MSNIEKRFEDATAEELAAAGDCLVCREGFIADCKGKKLPCSHIFHLECLRLWLQHQQTCPLCRAEIPVGIAPEVEEVEVEGDDGIDVNEVFGDDEDVVEAIVREAQHTEASRQTVPDDVREQLEVHLDTLDLASGAVAPVYFPAFFILMIDQPVCKSISLQALALNSNKILKAVSK
jgi:hypothetical protein